MSSGAGSYVEPPAGSDLIDLDVVCLSGEGCVLRVSSSSLGREVRQMVSERLEPKKGARPELHHLAAPLVLHQTLQEQGIEGAATLSCTYVTTDLYTAWSFLRGQGFSVSEGDAALEGVTHIAGVFSLECMHRLPRSLESLTLGRFNQGLERVSLPSNLQSLTFGDTFNKSLEGVTFPRSLKSLILGESLIRASKG